MKINVVEKDRQGNIRIKFIKVCFLIMLLGFIFGIGSTISSIMVYNSFKVIKTTVMVLLTEDLVGNVDKQLKEIK